VLYTDITRDWFTAIQDSAQQKSGVLISGDQGTASGQAFFGRITIQWVYDPADLTLTIGAIHKPFLLRESMIEKGLTELVESSKPQEVKWHISG
jgi:hypothetical protein